MNLKIKTFDYFDLTTSGNIVLYMIDILYKKREISLDVKIPYVRFGQSD